MNKYKITKTLGEGTFGSVLAGQNKVSGEKVAIKKMKQDYKSWKECVHLRELMSLKVLRHKNIVRLKEMVLENMKLHFVFEFCDGDLYKEIIGGNLTRKLIATYSREMFEALSYMHKFGYFHRDMKPENVLLKQGSIKIADFGLAREVRSRPPYTDYVSTRWYRGPELLLRSPQYNSPVDVWALGCIILEMFTTRPVFAGSSEMDMLMKIFEACGVPSKSDWSRAPLLMKKRGITSLPDKFVGISSLTEGAKIPVDDAALDMIKKCMIMNPLKRITATSALSHPFCHVKSTHEEVAAEEEPLMCTTVGAPSPDKESTKVDPLEETLDVDELMALIGEVEQSRSTAK